MGLGMNVEKRNLHGKSEIVEKEIWSPILCISLGFFWWEIQIYLFLSMLI